MDIRVGPRREVPLSLWRRGTTERNWSSLGASVFEFEPLTPLVLCSRVPEQAAVIVDGIDRLPFVAAET
jgi:hypothetical protein